ncbi:arginine--tRNA ligase [Deinococcus radiopugnans]|uniref:Arginine--tRNA ligase n=1 Tax=Deinococcus radiopugnans ATCC 19172 TaxID=585398 RepID=A0A5C4XXQ5_9DEIO|nr:arginine--tRNA ligase [Deinococcus radiopugnans]MBB6018164.1 arginyl-tRNA synthetase [Deinococcus radiopugnans ATCC 19172]TNM68240.1 arginine--tRNA ligase [Deinococcus radiopugnans ATCC 19172]
MDLKTQLKAAVEDAAQRLGAPIDAAIQETPAGKAGDYGTPAAFLIAKAVGGNPAQIAAQLAQTVDLPAGIKRVEAAGPFLNFFVDVAGFVRGVVERPFEMPRLSGKVVIEHTSVNPNKELHVGHLRNVVLGDSMARIFRAAGQTVEVQNYIDDTGRQAAESIFAVNHYGLTWDGVQKYDHWLGEGYVRLNADPAKGELEPGIRAIMHRLEAGELRSEVEKVVHAHLDTCFRLGARYDLLAWESDVVGSGFLGHGLNILEGSPYTSHPTSGKFADAFVMDVSSFLPNLEEPNVVLRRSDGTAMYVAKDVGYQFWKFGLFEGMRFKPFTQDPEGHTVWTSAPDGQPDTERRFGHADEVINVIDSRQEHPQKIVKAALGVAEQPEKEARSIHLSYAFVTLEGQTISGRKGVTVSADAAMDEAQKRALDELAKVNPELAGREDAGEIARRIGLGAIRFAMLKAEPTRKIDFRWEQALALNGDTAPYVQYAAVRAANILRKGQEAGFATDGSGADWDALPDIDLTLAKQVARLPEVVAQSVRVHSPHVVAQYALDLATSFNAWYNAKDKRGKPATNVLQSEEGLREARLALVARLRQAFEETLDLIGIEVPAAM